MTIDFIFLLLSPFHSRTALHLACAKAHKEIIIHLCSLHANVNLQDGDGATPMHKVRGAGVRRGCGLGGVCDHINTLGL